MKRTLIATATAATLALGAAVTAAQAQEEPLNMLQASVKNSLVGLNVESDRLAELSLNQIAQIKGVLDSDSSQGQKTQRIERIMNR